MQQRFWIMKIWTCNVGGFFSIWSMQFQKLCCTSEGDTWVLPVITVRGSPWFDFIYHTDDLGDEECYCQALRWCVALHNRSGILFCLLQAALLLLRSHWHWSAEPQLKGLSKDHFSSQRKPSISAPVFALTCSILGCLNSVMMKFRGTAPDKWDFL